MHILQSIISSFEAAEINEVKSFLKKNVRSELEQKLFDLLIKHPDARPQEIAGKIYRPVNMNAYHSLRKRLISKLSNFVVTKRISAESDTPDSPLALIAMARFLIERNQGAAALHYLNKVEETAAGTRRYALLERVYLLMIDHAGLLGISAAEISRKWDANADRYATFRKLKIAQAIIHDRFQEVKKKAFPPDPDTIIAPVLQSIKITSEEANHPAFQLALAAIIRRAYASVKDYDKVERFVGRVYRRLDQTGAFSAKDSDIRANFLYMQAHALYRIRAFARCLETLAALNEVLALRSTGLATLRAKALALEAAVYAYTGENDRSIALLENGLQSTVGMDMREKLNMRLNLAVYQFNATNYRMANRVLNQSALSDRRLDELMGVEWRFKRGMIALIIQYELGNTEISLNMIKRLQKEFGSFLSHERYNRPATFLNFVARLIQAPETVHTPEFREEIKSTSMMLTRSSDDIQGIAFFCWLRSKMFKRPYYEVLVERLNDVEVSH